VKIAEIVKSLFLRTLSTHYILRLQSNQVEEDQKHIVS